MSTRFKFRMWDQTSKKYDNSLVIDCEGRVGEWIGGLADENHGYVVEQFTGFKDRDGKDIYEGDILGRKGYINLTIEWSDGHFLGRNKPCGAEVDLNKNSAKEFEIIGNIHES